MLKKFFAALVTLLLASCSSVVKKPPTTASYVDLQRYMGTWYEIASFPNGFQKGCQQTRASYTLEKNFVRVVNQCYRNGKVTRAQAKAWPVKGSGNARLKVQFFWPFKGDYWILDVSKDYQVALVGSPNRKYLWVLSRKKQISVAAYESMVKKARDNGYDVSRLVKTKQTSVSGDDQ